MGDLTPALTPARGRERAAFATELGHELGIVRIEGEQLQLQHRVATARDSALR
jgi:hypothetical protein